MSWGREGEEQTVGKEGGSRRLTLGTPGGAGGTGDPQPQAWGGRAAGWHRAGWLVDTEGGSG